MRDWLNAKEEYEEKMKKLNLPPVQKEEPQVLIEPKSPSPKKNAKQPPPPTEEEKWEKARLEEEWIWMEQEKADHEMFGWYWIWENYYTPEKKDYWQKSAELLWHINIHVLQDINDFILMKIFKLKWKQDVEKMQKTIKEMHNTANHDDMFWTMKTIKNKDKWKEFWEKEEE